MSEEFLKAVSGISLATFVTLGLVAFIGIPAYFFSPPVLYEKRWQNIQEQRCFAAYGRGHYNADTKVFECWNRPIGRRPEVTFTEKFK